MISTTLLILAFVTVVAVVLTLLVGAVLLR